MPEVINCEWQRLHGDALDKKNQKTKIKPLMMA
jgi:hypothetical protein